MIRDIVEAERKTAQGEVRGIAGGASGGDVLFHEVCGDLGIPTTVFLAGPRDAYVAASVQASIDGAEWVRRLDRLLETRPVRRMGDALGVPPWHSARGRGAVWLRNNLWTLHAALAEGAANATLIALWNGEGGDGPGGTADMIRRARERGARAVVIDAKDLARP
jgi:hypothetical protein